MIGKFYPTPIYSVVNIDGPTYTVIVVAATSAATELTNDLVWLMNNN